MVTYTMMTLKTAVVLDIHYVLHVILDYSDLRNFIDNSRGAEYTYVL